MKKLLIIMAIVVVVPQVALASWWNPLSWGKTNNQNSEAVLEKRLAELEEKLATSSPQAKEIPVTKAVVQTIKVDNPELQIKINNLIKQNSDLVVKNNELTVKYNDIIGQLNQCKNDLVSKVPTSNDTTVSITTDSATLQRNQKLISLDAKVIPILDKFYELTKTYGGGCGDGIPKENLPDIANINYYLDAYRFVDPRMSFANIISDTQQSNVGQICKSLLDLRSYIKKYIEYR